MKLRRFKISNYKCIEDSGWINVNDLTVVVGKNEAGKTTLLKGLYKLKSFKNELYDIDREWPRGRRASRDINHIVCSAEFELLEHQTQKLFELTGIEPQLNFVTFNKHYSNEIGVDISKMFEDNLEDKENAVMSFLKEELPNFIYMDDYRVFNGTTQLDQLKQRVDRGQATDEDKTVLTILELSGLKIDEEVTKGNSPDREQRQYDLDDAAATLTKTIEDRWKQKKYEIQFRADGQQFFTFVKDEKDPALIKLEERSKGFQWFFSFDLMFMYESHGSFKNCILLLDEPGLHLHPDGQKDLLSRLEYYAQENTLIYTSHLPFMIDLQKPEGIRVITDRNGGTFVTEELTNSQPESKLVLQAALGMSGTSSYLISQKNLIVEGVDDFWFLSELSALFARSNEDYLDPDIFITPAGGASEAVYISTFMIGQRLQTFTLLDSDTAGLEAKDKLVKKWLTKYSDTKSEVKTLFDILKVEKPNFSIEDIFTEKYYLDKVQTVYKPQLTALDIKKIKLEGDDMICNRVERAMQKLNINFNKGSVAKAIRKEINLMKSSSELDAETKEYAAKIFSNINSFFFEES